MSRRPFKQVLAGLVSLTLAAPMAPLSAMAQDARPVDPDKPSDGAVSPAACRVFGFTLPEERNAAYAARSGPPVGGVYSRVANEGTAERQQSATRART